VWKLRRVLSGMASEGSGGAGLELLTDRMKTFKTNSEFLAEIGKVPAG
jgi:transcription termination factor Rho